VFLVTHEFLRDHRDDIIAAWERAAAAEQPVVKLTGSALRDSLPELLDELATWLEGASPVGTAGIRAAVKRHAAARLKDAYQLHQLVSEFTLLRTTILQVLLGSEPTEQADVGDGDKDRRAAELARLNAGLDHAIIDVVEEFLAGETAHREGAETALRDSEERLRALVAASSEVLYRMSPDWKEMRQLHGGAFLADTATADPNWVGRYIHPDDQQMVKAAIDEAIRTKSTFELEHRVIRADGSLGWTSSRAIPVKDASGAVIEWFGAASDITARKRAEEELRRSEAALEAFFDASPGILNLVDDEFRYVKADAITPAYFGLTRRTIIGKSVADLAPEFVEKFGPMMKRVMETGEPQLNIEVQSTVPSRPGEITHWQASYFPVPLPDGKRGYGVMGIDITDLKKAEAALREADRRKDEFIGMLSHELRNPLAAIRNYIYILRRADPASEPAARARTAIDRQTEHLTRLVDDLLDVNRIARGSVELRRERADLREVVRRTAEDLRSVIENRGVRFQIVVPDESVWAEIDVTRLTQVVGNLLQNAAKFTREGDTVTISVRAVDGAEEISVRDTGAGIAPALLTDIFLPFVQGERTLARTQGGLGLGLALVKGIIELHGGTVHAESAGRGRGAEFIVRLPVVPMAAAQERQHAGGGRSPTGRKVLVVEDNPDAADSLADVVRMLGHDVEVAYDGPSAIEKALANPPDIVLCDIGLPGMSGYEVAKALRAKKANGMQLVAVSGYAQPEDQKAAIEAGFDRHIAKPPNPEDIERLLG
jgi:PAS domain S-box-containing protein